VQSKTAYRLSSPKQKSKDRNLKNRKIPILVFFIFLIARLSAVDLVYTRSAWPQREGRGNLSVNLGKYLYHNEYGRAEREYLYLPVYMQYGLTSFVQLAAFLPIINARNVIESKGNMFSGGEGIAVGDFHIELKFSDDNKEPEYNYSIVVRYQYKSGVQTGLSPQEIQMLTDKSGVDRKITVSYYPFSKGVENLGLGYYLTTDLFKKIDVNFNATYTYEFGIIEDEAEGERRMTIKDFFKFENIIEKEKDKEGKETEKFKIKSFFGLEKMFKRLFWTSSKSDPWSDKRDDHITLSLSLDTFLDTDYYIGKKRVLIGLRPFVEFTGILNWHESSTTRSCLMINPGLWIKFTNPLRYMISFTFVAARSREFPFDTGLIQGIAVQF